MTEHDDDAIDPILERKMSQASGPEGETASTIEEEERAALRGPAKMQYATWFVIGLVVVFLLFMVGWWIF